MLIYGAFAAICGRGLSCQKQWETFATSRMVLTMVPSFCCLKVIWCRKESQTNEKKEKSRQAGWLFWRPYVGYTKNNTFPNWLYLAGEKLDQFRWLEGTLTSFVQMASLKSEITCGVRGLVCLHAPHNSFYCLICSNNSWVQPHPSSPP